MKNRKEALKILISRPSVLTDVISSSADLSQLLVSAELRQSVADKLEKLGSESAKSRAAFIREQDIDNFNANREKWGIPDFAEGLVTINDFENGFLWRFRAHTTSWSENQYADQWFYTSLEARSIRRYEFWNYDEGPDKMDFYFEGEYKSILQQLLADHIYEVLVSPVFSKKELTEYIANFDEDEEVYSLEEVIEDYISHNPNYESS